MTLRDRQTATPEARAYRSKRLRALRQRKTYAPDWQRPWRIWKVLDRSVFRDVVVLLCKQGADYGVFTDLLIDRSYPSDKFAGNLADAQSLFEDITKDVKKREATE